MSYIINNSGAFVNIKLTDTGRRKLAEGKLNFTAWGIGDSELNYNREEIVDNYQSDPELSGTSMVLRPVDRQPNLTSFISVDGVTPTNPLTANQINTLKAIVNNKAAERGFFSANTTHTEFATLLGDPYTIDSGCINNIDITGGTTLLLGTGYTYTEGDYILLKFTNDTVGNLSFTANTTPVPSLWYKIQATGSTYVIVDRELPNLNSFSATTCFAIYPQGEVYDAFGSSSTIPYWNSNTLSFDSCCYVSCSDVPVWNMNNVWCENLAGMTGSGINNIISTPNESYEKFGSWEYLGQKYPYLDYSCSLGSSGITIDICDVPGTSVLDTVSKSISIIHYTNNTISNYYGEFLFIDGANGKNVNIYMPDLMYHRRDYPTGSGTTMGMTFIATGSTKFIENTQIEYVDLIEDSTLLPSGTTPAIVGKVLPQFKVVVLDDDEIVAAISYKSNRNWTLPPLTANLISPSGNTSTGILPSNQYMWLTYTFENTSGSGLTTTLPCQKYVIMANNTSGAKDVQFRISGVDLLPYMRKIEDPAYDGLGFSANEFKVLYQIVSDGSRPAADAWKVHDFTSALITDFSGETINPVLLENQNPTAVNFKLDIPTTLSDNTFSIINSLSMAPNSNSDILQFGDERFFYGNIDTYIGANIYKTIFKLSVSADLFRFTSNPTRSSDPSTNPSVIKATECGIYDSTGDLVMIGKFSRPVKLNPGNTVLFELSMDF
jgi:hypothetical protein